MTGDLTQREEEERRKRKGGGGGRESRKGGARKGRREREGKRERDPTEQTCTHRRNPMRREKTAICKPKKKDLDLDFLACVSAPLSTILLWKS